MIDLGVHMQLPPTVVDGPLVILERQKDAIPYPLLLPRPQDGQIFAINRRRRRKARGVQERRVQIMNVRKRFGLLPGRYPGSTHNERTAHALLVHILLAHQAVTSYPQTVIRRVNDNGIPGMR